MGIYRVVFKLNGVLKDVYTDAPNDEVAAAIVMVQLQREGYKNVVIHSVCEVNGG